MSLADELMTMDATAQAELVRKGEATPLELVDAAIERIEQANPAVNAVITPMYDEARRAASGPAGDGPFAGVPFLLKDLVAMAAGVRMAAGSDLTGDFTPDRDSELVVRLRLAGHRVSVVKHAHHNFDIDHPGKDSHRHRAAGAYEVVIASNRRLAKIREYDEEAAPDVPLDTPADESRIYPDKKVARGHKWAVAPAQFARLLGANVTGVTGKASAHFRAVEKVNGEGVYGTEFALALHEAGFVVTPRGYTLRKTV